MIKYSNKVSFSFIVSQMRKMNTSDILCVKDGHELVVFKDTSELPIGLIREYAKDNTTIGTVEYHWRSPVLQSEYVFFEGRVDEFLSEKESENMAKVFILSARKQSRLPVIVEFKR